MFKVEKNEENISRCFCPNCPSHNECAKEKKENLYCVGENGKSSCLIEKKGCLCGACPVHAKYNLSSAYYCVNGSADETEDKEIM